MDESQTRKIYYLSAIAIVAIVLISAVVNTRPMLTQGPGPQPKTIQVTGVGRASAPPDELQLDVAVSTRAPTAAQAASDNAAAADAVFNALAEIGIGEDMVKTTSYSLQPVYDYSNGNSQLVGYAARHAIEATLTDLSMAGRVIDVAVAAGANEVGGVTFTLSDKAYTDLQTKALTSAVTDAQLKASTIASALGVRLVGPVSVTPSFVYQPVSLTVESATGAKTQIQPPSALTVSVSVQVSYEYA